MIYPDRPRDTRDITKISRDENIDIHVIFFKKIKKKNFILFFFKNIICFSAIGGGYAS